MPAGWVARFKIRPLRGAMIVGNWPRGGWCDLPRTGPFFDFKKLGTTGNRYFLRLSLFVSGRLLLTCQSFPLAVTGKIADIVTGRIGAE